MSARRRQVRPVEPRPVVCPLCGVAEDEHGEPCVTLADLWSEGDQTT